MASNAQKIKKELGKLGWIIEDGKHYFAYSPATLHCYSIPKTPSDRHSLPNLYHTMKRNGEDVKALKHLFK